MNSVFLQKVEFKYTLSEKYLLQNLPQIKKLIVLNCKCIDFVFALWTTQNTTQFSPILFLLKVSAYLPKCSSPQYHRECDVITENFNRNAV